MTRGAHLPRAGYTACHAPAEKTSVYGARRLLVKKIRAAIANVSKSLVMTKASWIPGMKDEPIGAVDAPPSALAVQVDGSHYKEMPIQPVEFIYRNNIGYMEGNVIKYVSRWRSKGGIADLHKAKHYIDLLIEMEAGPLNQ